MDQLSVQSILLSILTSIITGGFILVYVEIGNRKNRENDRYDQIMRPFMHKLSSYFRFLNWCSFQIKYPKQMSEHERDFKNLIEEIRRYGGRAIVSGGDYGVGYFSADKLNDICLKINNIWCYHDKMNPCNLRWDDCVGTEDYVSKELKEFFPNYLSHTRDVDLVGRVSGDFYTDIYQPIENETYYHEAYVEHFKRQTILVSIAVGFVLLVLVAMLFVQLPVLCMQVSGVVVVVLLAVCLLLLGMETNNQIKCYNNLLILFTKMRKQETKKKISIGIMNDRIKKFVSFLSDGIIPVGLMLSLWAILCLELGIIPKIPVSWNEPFVIGLNRVFLNLSYSYMAGLIVYLLAIKYPSLKKTRT